MHVKVLGCSGGIGDSLRTTTLLIDDDVLIDAGTGVGDLTLAGMESLRHIFLTHSHMDHISDVPLLVDTIFDRVAPPIVIHGLEETLKALQEHIFNNIIWPDFSRLPSVDKPVMRYQPMSPGETYSLGDRNIEMIAVNHIVPGVGYRVTNGEKIFAFSGDTTTNDNFWDVLNAHDRLDILVVEAAFPNRYRELSDRAGHYCPATLAADLAKLRHKADVYISHNKPGAEDEIFNECSQAITTHTVKRLQGGKLFTL